MSTPKPSSEERVSFDKGILDVVLPTGEDMGMTDRIEPGTDSSLLQVTPDGIGKLQGSVGRKVLENSIPEIITTDDRRGDKEFLKNELPTYKKLPFKLPEFDHDDSQPRRLVDLVETLVHEPEDNGSDKK